MCHRAGMVTGKRDKKKERGAAEPQVHKRRVQPWRWAMLLGVLALS